jgi:hypothetical protein
MGSKPPPAGSPAPSSGPPPSGNANGNARPASAIDLTSMMNKPGAAGTHVRSGLAPPGLDSAPPTPMGTKIAPGSGNGGPPPSRPKSQASQKRNVRGRYVDVFAQESSAGGGA